MAHKRPGQRPSRDWDGHLDLDALADDVADLLGDLAAADRRVDRATERTVGYWERLYGDDPVLCSVPGMGKITAPSVRAFLADGTGFDSAAAAASYAGLTPSNWSSGTVDQPSRAITKEGPAALRLASTRRPTPRGSAIPSWHASITG